jgi:dephospho-CoA kinase
MLVIGLTGSIATGKSTASQTLSSPPLSLPVIDADKLAREVVEPGTPGYAAIVARFGPTTSDLLLPESESMPKDGLTGHGRPLDRAALGRRVFGSDPQRVGDRQALNGIVHPAVRRAMVRKVLGAYVRGAWAVVLDVPLLFESGLDVFCGVVLVVGMRDKISQIKRLLARDRGLGGKMTEDEARGRIESQESIETKVLRLRERGTKWGSEIWNDGAKEELPAKLTAFVDNEVHKWSPNWWHTLLWAFPPLALLSAAWTIYWAGKARKQFEEKTKAEKEGKAKL